MICTRCEGRGWYWLTPDGFNPFKAGGFATARAMYRQPCSCAAQAMDETELLACPFCNGEATAVTVLLHRQFERVECRVGDGGCGASTRDFDTEAEAIAAWNTRPANARIAELEATIEAMRASVRRNTPPYVEELAAGVSEQPSPSDGLAGERCVMVCPQCEGEGGYADGIDEAACHEDCPRCGTNGWIVDLSALTTRETVVEECAQVAEEYPSIEYADIPVIRGIAHAIRTLAPATDSNVQKAQIAPSTQKGGPGCP